MALLLPQDPVTSLAGSPDVSLLLRWNKLRKDAFSRMVELGVTRFPLLSSVVRVSIPLRKSRKRGYLYI